MQSDRTYLKKLLSGPCCLVAHDRVACVTSLLTRPTSMVSRLDSLQLRLGSFVKAQLECSCRVVAQAVQCHRFRRESCVSFRACLLRAAPAFDEPIGHIGCGRLWNHKMSPKMSPTELTTRGSAISRRVRSDGPRVCSCGQAAPSTLQLRPASKPCHVRSSLPASLVTCSPVAPVVASNELLRVARTPRACVRPRLRRFCSSERYSVVTHVNSKSLRDSCVSCKHKSNTFRGFCPSDPYLRAARSVAELVSKPLVRATRSILAFGHARRVHSSSPSCGDSQTNLSIGSAPVVASLTHAAGRGKRVDRHGMCLKRAARSNIA